ncbi:MAG: AbrB/MazE/SpoVT family DNA-binding domain-containing protein [Clostridia bacterium]|nr:AbrB/MazE/SpoVT family DNA-binding domain-containing protein [Clostridia bacterium]
MKATGIVRRFDENGRFVLPMEVRRMLDLDMPGDAVEVYLDGESVVLKKYNPSCLFCGEADDLVVYKEKRVCRKCVEKLVMLAED